MNTALLEVFKEQRKSEASSLRALPAPPLSSASFLTHQVADAQRTAFRRALLRSTPHRHLAVQKTVATTFYAAAEQTFTELRGAKSESPLSFNKTNKRSIEWIRKHTGDLIVGISGATQDAIAAIMEKAFAKGLPPEQAAKLIAKKIGLDPRRAEAVDNLWTALEENPGKVVEAGGKRIRVPKEGASKSFLEKQTGAYADKLLKDRALTIARTETIAAANAGQREAWKQAQENGLLAEAQTQVWVSTPDDRECPICDELDGTEIALDDVFDADGEDVEGPPAHPNCRCAVVLGEVKGVEVDREASVRLLGGPGSGNFGHGGRPGEVGGSAPDGGGAVKKGGGMNTYRKEFGRRQREDKAREKAGLPKLERRPIAEMRKEGLLPRVDPPKEKEVEVAPISAVLPSPQEETPKETGLIQTPQSDAAKLGGGINETYLVTLENGDRGVFKPAAGESRGARRNIENGLSTEREVAGYEVAKALGMTDLVPVTVARAAEYPKEKFHYADNEAHAREIVAGLPGNKTYDQMLQAGQIRPGYRGPGPDPGTMWIIRQEVPTSGRGSLQEFREGKTGAAIIKDGQAGDAAYAAAYPKGPDLERAAIFDHIIGNTDRHMGNWMIGPSGKLALIDHGLSFPHTNQTGNGNRELVQHVYTEYGANRDAAQSFRALRDAAVAQRSNVEAAMRRAGLDKGKHGAARISGVHYRLDQLARAETWADLYHVHNERPPRAEVVRRRRF